MDDLPDWALNARVVLDRREIELLTTLLHRARQDDSAHMHTHGVDVEKLIQTLEGAGQVLVRKR